MEVQSIKNINALIESSKKENIVLAFQLIHSNSLSLNEVMRGWDDLKEIRQIKEIKTVSNVDFLIDLFQVKRLVIDMKEVKFLPRKLNKLKNLEKLGIKNAPKEMDLTSIKDLYQLSFLKISGEVEFLQKELENFYLLKSLHLEDNAIRELPSNIGKLRNLESLNLHNNNLRTLPVEIEQLKKLEWLSLYNNPIKELPGTIRNLLNLKYLSLGDTSLSSSELEKIKKILPNCKVYH